MEKTNNNLVTVLNACIDACKKCIQVCRVCKLQAAADDHDPVHCNKCIKHLDSCIEACKNVISTCRDHLKVCSNAECIESVVQCIKVNEECISVAQHAQKLCTANFDEQCGLSCHKSNIACDNCIQASQVALEHLCSEAKLLT